MSTNAIIKNVYPDSIASDCGIEKGDAILSVNSYKFKDILDFKYLTSDKYLKRGDIVVKANRHTIMILSNGSAIKNTTTNTSSSFSSYLVRVQVDALNIRKGAGVTHAKVGVIKDRGVYTIVKEKKNGLTTWGLLKSGAAKEDKWISLKYTKKV